jgi:hypothetical protein
VQTEMLAALKVGRQTIDNVVRQIADSPHPQREIDDLLDSFRGSRHLRVEVTAVGAAPAEIHPVDDRSRLAVSPVGSSVRSGSSLKPNAYRSRSTAALPGPSSCKPIQAMKPSKCGTS